MANYADNTFYASMPEENIKAVESFFKGWPYANYETNYDGEYSSIDAWFESRWRIPLDELTKLYESLPNKDNIYMRCLSVEYGCDYVAYYTCDEDGWRQVV